MLFYEFHIFISFGRKYHSTQYVLLCIYIMKDFFLSKQQSGKEVDIFGFSFWAKDFVSCPVGVPNTTLIYLLSSYVWYYIFYFGFVFLATL